MALQTATSSVLFKGTDIALTSGMAVSSSSSIYSLQPILDSERLVRVGGSLSHSDLPYSQQHPIILHRKAHLTKLLVQHLHLLPLHDGPTLLLGTLSHEYYVGVFIPQDKDEVQKNLIS